MLRTRLAGAALLTFTILPGCGLFSGDRPGLCGRWCNREPVAAIPASYPYADPGFGTMAIPTSGNVIYGAPIYGSPPMPAPGATVIPGDSLPPMGATPRIPRAGIEEGKGRQFELEGASRTGPVGPTLMMPSIKPGD